MYPIIYFMSSIKVLCFHLPSTCTVTHVGDVRCQLHPYLLYCKHWRWEWPGKSAHQNVNQPTRMGISPPECEPTHQNGNQPTRMGISPPEWEATAILTDLGICARDQLSKHAFSSVSLHVCSWCTQRRI